MNLWRRVAVHSALAVALVTCVAGTSEAQTDTAVAALKPVIVTVTRGSGRTVLGSPFAISISQPDSSRPGQRHASIDETLALIPGVVAVNRSNPSQDARISIRGFGSRSTFGVRGVRVLRDGMPITLPDGQTPLDYVSLESVGTVEVLRGAASALYGNAAGGVIDLRSVAPSPHSFSGAAGQWLGSDAMSRTTLRTSGAAKDATYAGDITYSSGDGSREHARQRSTIGFARATASAAGTEYSMTVMGLVNPLAQNPGPLTLAEMQADSRMADAASLRRNARKAVNQFQLGVSAAHPIANLELSLSAYGGARSLDNPLTFAVVEVGRHTWGLSGAVRTRGTFPRPRNSLVAGFDLQLQNDLRRNFAPCADTILASAPTPTCPVPGNDRGQVTLDQRELVSSTGVYASDEISLGKRIGLNAGLRLDRVRFEVDDRLITAQNPDDSGNRTLSAVSPVAGVIARLAPTHSVYANVSTAFETPTATELGNHADGTAGINPDLDPQRSLTAEIGMKGWIGSRFRYDAAAFRTAVRDELVPFEIPASNGRRYFRNAGRTRRSGMEVGADLAVHPIMLMAAYAYSGFRFQDYTPGPDDFAGHKIPGIPEHRLQGAVRVSAKSAFVLVETEHATKTWLDDANTSQAPAYTVTNVRAGLFPAGRLRGLSVTTGLQNIFDESYSSSLSVNAARGKFFEPAPARNFYVGVSIGRTR